jgi:peptidoglycan/LPS O-acetylase OafA/YrhL
MNEKVTGEILPLTTVRFLAALFVFLFHIHARWPITNIEYISILLLQGPIGMSVFFVLSGFVLTVRYHDDMKPKIYFLHRFARIYPVYFLAMILTTPFLLQTVGFYAEPDSIMPQIRLLFLVVVDMLLVQAWMPQTFIYWNNGASWSISVEAFFYTAFPAILGPIKSLSTRHLAWLTGGVILLGAIPGISHLLLNGKQHFAVFYAIPAFRLPDFLLGKIAGVFYLRGIRIRFFWAVLALALTIAYFEIGGRELYKVAIYTTHNWIVLPAIMAVIWGCASLRPGQFAARILSLSPAVYLGRVSYSFYSMQIIIIIYLISNHDSVAASYPLLADNRMLCLVCFAILLAMSVLCYHLVEEPLRKRISKAYKPQLPPSPNAQP